MNKKEREQIAAVLALVKAMVMTDPDDVRPANDYIDELADAASLSTLNTAIKELKSGDWRTRQEQEG